MRVDRALLVGDVVHILFEDSADGRAVLVDPDLTREVPHEAARRCK